MKRALVGSPMPTHSHVKAIPWRVTVFPNADGIVINAASSVGRTTVASGLHQACSKCHRG